MSRANTRPREHDGGEESGLQLASRLVALVKSGRAYSVKHVAFTQQLENFLVLLRPLLMERHVVRFDAPDGDLCLNGDRLPLRSPLHRQAELLVAEFDARTIAGIELTSEVSLPALQAFFGYFLVSERWKGDDLIQACQGAGIVGVRALGVTPLAASAGAAAAADELPETLGGARAVWTALYAGTQQLLSGDALDQGIELRHLKRLLQPVVDAVIGGEHVTAALAHIQPGEPRWAHAMHVMLTAITVGHTLGLSRRDLADVAVAALLHDTGHDWGADSYGDDDTPPAPHTLEGTRRMAWVTTLNRNSLDAMRVALEHHDPCTSLRHGGTPALMSQLVSIADAYVTLLSRGGKREGRLSPASALARVIGPLRSHWHPALPVALVQALGLHPPGQVVELDDGAVARTLAPDHANPERPWIQILIDERGRMLPRPARTTGALPEGKRITRALPIEEWPAEPGRSAA